MVSQVSRTSLPWHRSWMQCLDDMQLVTSHYLYPSLKPIPIRSMSQIPRSQISNDKAPSPGMPLQLLLFVNNRPSTQERAIQVIACLDSYQEEYPFELQIIDVSEQPYLAEYYRLVATPALIKIHPEPRHTLAGSNLVEQLQHWWNFWRQAADEYVNDATVAEAFTEINKAKELLKGQSEEAPSNHPSSDAQAMMGAAAQYRPTSGNSASLKLTAPFANQSLVRSAEIIQLSDEIFRIKKEKEELENQLKFKDQIIAMLAHDLRNPITAASLALETLEMGHNPDKGWSQGLAPTQISQLLNHARNQIKAIDRMITDILSRMQVQPQRLDLRQLCFEVLDGMSDRFAAKSLHIGRDIPSDLPPVLADPERIRQVLINLLDNAIKYTPDHGKLLISALHRKTQEVQVSVSDDGPGIPLDAQDRIFEDRFRLQRDIDKEGYGIGLALCRRIVQAHCGKIWVDSTPGQGSCFHFTLPAVKA